MNYCWLARYSQKPCDGRLVRCHLIPRQQLRAAWRSVHHPVKGQRPEVALPPHEPLPFKSLRDLIDDPRTWVWGCGGPMGNGGHHGELDQSRTIRVPFADLPSPLLVVAEQLNLTWWLEREYAR